MEASDDSLSLPELRDRLRRPEYWNRILKSDNGPEIVQLLDWFRTEKPELRPLTTAVEQQLVKAVCELHRIPSVQIHGLPTAKAEQADGLLREALPESLYDFFSQRLFHRLDDFLRGELWFDAARMAEEGDFISLGTGDCCETVAYAVRTLLALTSWTYHLRHPLWANAAGQRITRNLETLLYCEIILLAREGSSRSHTRWPQLFLDGIRAGVFPVGMLRYDEATYLVLTA